ncbi:esterase/lipase family protein [Duganella sp. BuS-21]|uniref:esterase/lipase family protein n=1 Tax=Duganella sp. BuS-21 TaxID=2943848 RepID=UPI0035A68D88
MATSGNRKEPTRPVPSYEDHEGNLRAYTSLSPKVNNTRAAVAVPPAKVMPVIVVAGIMGSNLRAHINPADGKNKELNPGEAAWRPPNGVEEGLKEAKKWKSRDAAVRQAILDGDTLEVDPDGAIPRGFTTNSFVWDEKIAKERGWGEIHLASYGMLLASLQQNLNTTYWSVWGTPTLEENWQALNVYDRSRWGIDNNGIGAPLTDEEMKKFAEFHYPVYGFGYNWLKSNEISAQSLKKRIESIIAYWKSKKRECNAVLLVTHSMGGLVARACAQQIPQLIAGVIHGVMPALGAPVCYRRLACGTESSSPSNSLLENMASEKFAEIAGLTMADTTAVLATAPGPLELLPNHIYPKPWLFAQTKGALDKPFFTNLCTGNPYDLYAEFKSWYRLIDPAFADPGNNYKGLVKEKIVESVFQAQKFHIDILQEYYHPKTFVFYGDDKTKLSFGTFRWKFSITPSVLTEANLRNAKLDKYLVGGGRRIEVRPNVFADVVPSVQDVAGDGTVPAQSGIAPQGKVKHLFSTQGYAHQGSYSNADMLSLTRHLIVKLMQDV